MLAVPLDLFALFGVQAQPVGELVLLVHPVRHIVPPAELVLEPVALAVNQKTPTTPQLLLLEEQGFLVRFFRIHQPGGVDLDGVQIDLSLAHIPH